MKIYVRNKKRDRDRYDSHAELEVDVGGLTEDEAEDFVDDVKRRVKLVFRDSEGRYSSPRRRCRESDRRTIDLNINVRGE